MLASTLRWSATGPLMALAMAALGQPAEPDTSREVALETRIERLVDTGGGTRLELVRLEDLEAGSEVIVSVMFTNVTDQPLHDVRISVPIPPPLRYVGGTAVAPGAAALYSVDGGLRYAPPEELVVPGSQGAERPAAAPDYTHVRWLLMLPLDAGSRGTARFRAVVPDPV